MQNEKSIKFLNFFIWDFFRKNAISDKLNNGRKVSLLTQQFDGLKDNSPNLPFRLSISSIFIELDFN